MSKNNLSASRIFSLFREFNHFVIALHEKNKLFKMAVSCYVAVGPHSPLLQIVSIIKLVAKKQEERLLRPPFLTACISATLVIIRP